MLRDVMVHYTSWSDILVSPVALCTLGALMTCIHALPHERPATRRNGACQVPTSGCNLIVRLTLAYFLSLLAKAVLWAYFFQPWRCVCVCTRLRGRMSQVVCISLYDEFSHSRQNVIMSECGIRNTTPCGTIYVNTNNFGTYSNECLHYVHRHCFPNLRTRGLSLFFFTHSNKIFSLYQTLCKLKM